MADTHEIAADIIAEMRKTKYGDSECEVKWCLTQWADRLEAALRREADDAAKLREALTKVKEWMEHRIATCGFEASATFPTMLEDVVLPALNAPPRNCDRPECATTKAAQEVWRREDGGKTAYYEWLLATATEKEVGNYGNE